MKPNEKEKDSEYFNNNKSPCCGSKLKHELSKFNQKPYQRWVCVKCGTGWNNTTTDTWNMKQQGITPSK